MATTMKNPMQEVNESHMKNHSFMSMLNDVTEPEYDVNPENIFDTNKLKSAEKDLICGNGGKNDFGIDQYSKTPANNQVCFIM